MPDLLFKKKKKLYSMFDDGTIAELQQSALMFLAENLDKHYTYHNAEHSREVCSAVREFLHYFDTTPENSRALILAAVFHDFGYLVRSQNNEALALPYMQEFGKRFALPEQLLTRANDLILETVYPYAPHTREGMLLCDADIEYIGRSCFFSKAQLFRQELSGENIHFSDRDFMLLEIKFLEENSFFTPVCQKLRSAGRLQNLQQLRTMFEEKTYQISR